MMFLVLVGLAALFVGQVMCLSGLFGLRRVCPEFQKAFLGKWF